MFPSNIPSYTPPDPSASLDANNHTARHASYEDELAALAGKIGVGASVAASGEFLVGDGAGSSVWRAAVKGDVGLGNVDNTSDATKDSATAVLTNKTLTAPVIADFTSAQHDHVDADGGGTLGANTVGASQIINNSVTSSEIETQEAWIAVTFQNSWINYDSSIFQPASYYKDSLGIVHLKGLVKNGTMGATIFTLPVGYRPTRQLLMVILSNNSLGRIDITTGGAVTPTAGLGTNAFVQLDNIHFRAEQ